MLFSCHRFVRGESKDGDARAGHDKASSRGREHLVDYERSEIIYLVIRDRFSVGSDDL